MYGDIHLELYTHSIWGNVMVSILPPFYHKKRDIKVKAALQLGTWLPGCLSFNAPCPHKHLPSLILRWQRRGESLLTGDSRGSVCRLSHVVSPAWLILHDLCRVLVETAEAWSLLAGCLCRNSSRVAACTTFSLSVFNTLIVSQQIFPWVKSTLTEGGGRPTIVRASGSSALTCSCLLKGS